MSLKLKLVYHEDDKWIYGCDVMESGASVSWIKITDREHRRYFWFLYPTNDIGEQIKWPKLNDSKVVEFDRIIEEWRIEAFYYVHQIISGKIECLDSVVNWIIGPMTEILNEWEIPLKKLPDLWSAEDLRKFLDMTQEEGFIKSKTKHALRDFLHGFSLNHIKKDSDYWAKDDNSVDEILDRLFDENQAKLDNPKMKNWFVGQVMKETKGSADPASVKQKVESKFNGGQNEI
jgi:Glu-tRNA(Gln) amidotransferase subunit E-like FAD-binding protein